MTVVFFAGLWIVDAAWQSAWSDPIFANTLGHRMMFPAVPLLAAFAALILEKIKYGTLILVAVPSVVCGYLSAQAGFIPDASPFPYALKTWVSGTGMGVLFKEALPAWLGLDTLHTIVSRPDVSVHDLLPVLLNGEGLLLVRNQMLFLAANLAVLGILASLLRGLWRDPGSA